MADHTYATSTAATPGELEEASIEPITDSLIPSDVTAITRTPSPPSQSQSTAEATPTSGQPAGVLDAVASEDLFTVKFQSPIASPTPPDPVPPLDVPETAEEPLDDSLQLSAVQTSTASMAGSTDSYVIVTDSPPQPTAELLPQEPEPPAEWLDVLGNGSLKKLTLSRGGGPQAARGQRALLDLTGRLLEMEGDVVEEELGLEVEVGEADVVQGLDLALPLMSEGEVAWVYMKSRFGYGETGNGDNIPADTDLYYKVTLREVHPRYDYAALTEDQLRELVERKKARGNSLYKLSQLTSAATAYSSALKALQAHEYSDTPEGKLIGCRILTNLAIVQCKQEQAQQSLESCDSALRLVPGDTKALFRKSVILTGRQEYEGAISCLEEALRSSREDRGVELELRRVRALNEQSNRRQREVYRRMFRGPALEQTQPRGTVGTDREGGRSKLVVLVASSVVAVAAICMGVFLYKRL